MPATGQQQPLQPITPDRQDSGASLAHLQERLAELTAGHSASPLRPVTFRCYGSGAQLDREDSARVLFTFPVDEGRCVRVSASIETAREFWQSLTETLGGVDALRVHGLKRGCRR